MEPREHRMPSDSRIECRTVENPHPDVVYVSVPRVLFPAYQHLPFEVVQEAGLCTWVEVAVAAPEAVRSAPLYTVTAASPDGEWATPYSVEEPDSVDNGLWVYRVPIQPRLDRLWSHKEDVLVNLSVTVLKDGQRIYHSAAFQVKRQRTERAIIRIADFGEEANVPFGLFPVFVTPGDPCVAAFHGQVWDSAFTGHTVRHIYETIRHNNCNFITGEQPAVISGLQTQLVKFPAQTLEEKSGNCLDYAVLFAALLEYLGQHPLIVVLAEENHAIVGWREPGHGQSLKLLDASGAARGMTFEQASKVASDMYNEAAPLDRVVVDVRLRRERAPAVVPFPLAVPTGPIRWQRTPGGIEPDDSTGKARPIPSDKPGSTHAVEEQIRTMTLVHARVCIRQDGTERLCLEEERSLFEEVMARVTGSLLGAGGRVLHRFREEAVMGFGFPKTSEEAPETAVHSCLSFLSTFASDSMWQEGISEAMASVQFGIETGRILLSIDDEADSIELFGDAMDRSRELCRLAPPGTVLVGPVTRRIVHSSYETTPAVEAAEGTSASAHQVLRRRDLTYRPDSSSFRGIETKMFGRQMEQQLLGMALRGTLEERRLHLVTIEGPAGAGKTRLVQAFLTQDTSLWDTVWTELAQCGPETANSPYAPLLMSIRKRAGIEIHDSPQLVETKLHSWLEPVVGENVLHLGLTLEQLSAQIRLALGHRVDAAHFNQGALTDFADQMKKTLFAAIVLVFRSMLQLHPMLLMLDDFQWSARETRDLLASLAAGLVDQPLLVILVSRKGFEGIPAVTQRFSEQTTAIRLQNLSQKVCEEFVLHLLRKVDVPPRFLASRIYELSGGNPYFVQELLNTLIDQRKIVPGEQHWHCRLVGPADVELPATVEAMVHARLDRLPEAQLDVAQKAAVVGQHFWPSLLNLMGSEDSTPLVESLCLKGLAIREYSPLFPDQDEYRFRNVVVRQVLERHLPRSKSTHWHTLAARWLIANAGTNLPDLLDRVAHHRYSAGQIEEALQDYLTCGKRAERLFATEEACRHYQQAVRILRTLVKRTKSAVETQTSLLETLVKLGDSQRRLGHYRQGLATLDSALLNADHFAGEDNVREWYPLRISALLAKGRIFEDQGALLEALETFESAKSAILEQELEPVWMMRACARCAAIYQRTGRFGLALAELEGTISQLDGTDSLTAELADVHNIMGNAASHLGMRDRAARDYRQAHEFYSSLGNQLGVANVTNNVGTLHFLAGELDDASRKFDEALALFSRIGDEYGRAMVLSNLGETAFRSGGFSDALEKLQLSAHVSRLIGTRDLLPDTLRVLAEVHLAKGDLGLAASAGQEALDTAIESGNRTFLATAQVAMADIHAAMVQRGDIPDCREKVVEFLEAAISTFSETGQETLRDEARRKLEEFLKLPPE